MALISISFVISSILAAGPDLLGISAIITAIAGVGLGAAGFIKSFLIDRKSADVNYVDSSFSILQGTLNSVNAENVRLVARDAKRGAEIATLRTRVAELTERESQLEDLLKSCQATCAALQVRVLKMEEDHGN